MDNATIALLVAGIGLAMALVKILDKVIDSMLAKKAEAKAERNGTSSSHALAKLSEILERMDRRQENLEPVLSARDAEGRPRVWFPEATIARTHEAVRGMQLVQNELVRSVDDNSKKLDDVVGDVKTLLQQSARPHG